MLSTKRRGFKVRFHFRCGLYKCLDWWNVAYTLDNPIRLGLRLLDEIWLIQLLAIHGKCEVERDSIGSSPISKHHRPCGEIGSTRYLEVVVP